MSEYFCVTCLDCQVESTRMNRGTEALRELREIYAVICEPLQELHKLNAKLSDRGACISFPNDCIQHNHFVFPGGILNFLVEHHYHHLVIQSEYSTTPDELFSDRSDQS